MKEIQRQQMEEEQTPAEELEDIEVGAELEKKDIPPISGTGDATLKVIVTDRGSGKPIQGIPVWCYQIHSRWNHETRKTNSKGIVEFKGLNGGGVASYGVNYGGFFGCSEVREKRVSMFNNKTTVRREKLTCKGGGPKPPDDDDDADDDDGGRTARVTGTVYARGKPLSGVRIRKLGVYSCPGGQKEVRTNRSGRYSINCCQGEGGLMAEASRGENCDNQAWDQYFKAGKKYSHDFHLTCHDEPPPPPPPPPPEEKEGTGRVSDFTAEAVGDVVPGGEIRVKAKATNKGEGRDKITLKLALLDPRSNIVASTLKFTTLEVGGSIEKEAILKIPAAYQYDTISAAAIGYHEE